MFGDGMMFCALVFGGEVREYVLSNSVVAGCVRILIPFHCDTNLEQNYTRVLESQAATQTQVNIRLPSPHLLVL
jgi:hypothetical protein